MEDTEAEVALRERAQRMGAIVGSKEAHLIIDDTAIPKKGTHSVGVAQKNVAASPVSELELMGAIGFSVDQGTAGLEKRFEVQVELVRSKSAFTTAITLFVPSTSTCWASTFNAGSTGA